MQPTMITLIGLVAACCTTLAFLPQAYQVIKTKHTKDLSLGMYVLFTIGVSLWLLYGYLTLDIPVIAANSVTLLLSITILILKLKYK